MYWKEILWLLSWPLIIWINYRIIRFVLARYEKKYPDTGTREETSA
jgi:hypothetical protein